MSSFIPAIATRRHPAPRASRAKKKTKQSFLHNHLVSPSCDPGGARTHDPLIKNQLLCQLSYGVNGAFISELRLQRYDFFLNYQHYSRFFSKKSSFSCFGEPHRPPTSTSTGNQARRGGEVPKMGVFCARYQKTSNMLH